MPSIESVDGSGSVVVVVVELVDVVEVGSGSVVVELVVVVVDSDVVVVDSSCKRRELTIDARQLVEPGITTQLAADRIGENPPAFDLGEGIEIRTHAPSTLADMEGERPDALRVGRCRSAGGASGDGGGPESSEEPPNTASDNPSANEHKAEQHPAHHHPDLRTAHDAEESRAEPGSSRTSTRRIESSENGAGRTWRHSSVP